MHVVRDHGVVNNGMLNLRKLNDSKRRGWMSRKCDTQPTNNNGVVNHSCTLNLKECVRSDVKIDC